MKAFVSEKKRLFCLSNFPGTTILKNCDVSWCPYRSRTNAPCVSHNFSRWRRPENLKAKTSVLEIHFYQIQTLSLENV